MQIIHFQCQEIDPYIPECVCVCVTFLYTHAHIHTHTHIFTYEQLKTEKKIRKRWEKYLFCCQIYVFVIYVFIIFWNSLSASLNLGKRCVVSFFRFVKSSDRFRELNNKVISASLCPRGIFSIFVRAAFLFRMLRKAKGNGTLICEMSSLFYLSSIIQRHMLWLFCQHI